MARRKMIVRVENGDGDSFSVKVKMIIGDSGSKYF